MTFSENVNDVFYRMELLDGVENLHEITKLNPHLLKEQFPIVRNYVENPDLLDLTSRSRKMYVRTLPRTLVPSSNSDAIAQLMRSRLSTRVFADASVCVGDLGDILIFGAGRLRECSLPNGMSLRFSAYPSAGALYPVETYVFVYRVEGLPNGIHYFDPIECSLYAIDDVKSMAVERALNTQGKSNFAFAIINTIIVERSTAKYGPRGYRFALLEAGHIQQNFHLIACNIGLGASCLGGYFDDLLQTALNLDEAQEWPVHVSLFGRRC